MHNELPSLYDVRYLNEGLNKPETVEDDANPFATIEVMNGDDDYLFAGIEMIMIRSQR